MTIQHSAITDPNNHEPKGVTSAAANQVYVADGAGSGNWGPVLPEGIQTAPAGAIERADGTGDGDWLRVQGWGLYQDSRRTVGTPTQNIATGVRTQMVCNGGFLTSEHLPSDATDPLWNITTNVHNPIAINDMYMVRIGFAAENYGGSSPYIDIDLDIGGSIGQIYWDSISLRKGGSQQRVSFSFPVFTGSTYVPNKGTFYLTYNGTGTCDIYATDVLIVRISKAYV